MKTKTPCLEISKKIVIEVLNKYLDLGLVYYPVKANAHPQLIKLLYRNGANFNVSSVYYLHKLLKLGVPASKILWDNCFSPMSDIDITLDAGVKKFAVDSEEQINYIEERCVDALYFIKVSNHVVDSGIYRFGAKEPLKVKSFLDEKKMLGFSFHLGVGKFNEANFKTIINYIKSFGNIRCLNIGGGYEDFFSNKELLNFLISEKQEGWFESVAFEPGRSLLYPSSKYYAKVLCVKQQEKDKFAKIDASIYSGLMDRYIESRNYEIIDGAPQKEKYIVYGFTSDSSDCFGVQMLSDSLKAGDVVEIKPCGAYSVDMSCKYSGANKLLVRMV